MPLNARLTAGGAAPRHARRGGPVREDETLAPASDATREARGEVRARGRPSPRGALKPDPSKVWSPTAGAASIDQACSTAGGREN